MRDFSIGQTGEGARKRECVCVCELTYGDIRGAVCLQEPIEVLPGLGDPVDDLNQVIAAHVLSDLCLYQFPPQETAQESFDWLCVVGAQHPPVTGHIISEAT